MDDEDDWFLDYLDDVVFNEDEEPARRSDRGLVADWWMAVGIILGVILCVLLALLNMP